MDIEAIVKKYYEEWQTVPEASIRDQLRAALTELAAGYEKKQALLFDAHCERVKLLQERIRQLSETLAIEQRACNKLAHDHGFLLAEREHLQERIRQLSETHAIELRAYEATVANQAERIRQLEDDKAEYDRRIVAVGGVAINSVSREYHDAEVARLNALYESAVKGRQDFREAYRMQLEAERVPDGIVVSSEWLRRIHRDLDACQKVIWLGMRDADPSYCADAKVRLKEIDAMLAAAPQQKKEGE